MDAREYENEFFTAHGFRRQTCKGCGSAFWSETPRELCAETPCTPYSFLGASPFNRSYQLDEFREAYLGYFEKNGHTRVRRYPVVPRWRKDVMFVQASIYDFQPWVTSGVIEPPANPLTISQPCLRFNDIENVGQTARHLTQFEMMAHHAFNKPGHEIYFKARTIELCHQLLTQELGVKGTEISYKEEVWEGGGNLGPSVSVGVRGLELATLVFMQYIRDGESLKPMPLTVVDTGYGLERFVWESQGTPTIYDAVFPKFFGDLPAEFTLAERAVLIDHAKSFLFMFTDGVVPSNVHEGYLARLLLRRMLRILQKHRDALTLTHLMTTVVGHVAASFPEVAANPSGLRSILEIEEARFSEALIRGRQQVRRIEERLGKEGKTVGVEDLVAMYDSLGVTPDVAVEELRTKVAIPDDFFVRVASRHENEAAAPDEEEAVAVKVPDPPSTLPPTEVLYPLDPYTLTFEAKVLWRDGRWVLLDRSFFYPTGGGQITDTGRLGDQTVDEVVRKGPWVLHHLTTDPGPAVSVGATVSGAIDGPRRRQLMAHHTATHLLNGALRATLGPHIWQAGAYKGTEGARLDVTHYKALTPEELRNVERAVNLVVREDRPVKSYFLGRGEAEAKFGFGLYQGGAVPGFKLRIVEVPDFDTEACGGTHCTRTAEVGLIKVFATERIQDGMLRFHFAAGDRALEMLQDHESILNETSKKLAAPVEEIPAAVDRLLERLKATNKERKAADTADVKVLAKKLGASSTAAHSLEGGKVRVISAKVDLTPDGLKELARLLTSEAGVVALLAAESDDGKGQLFFASSLPQTIPARDLFDAARGSGWDGKGGGSPAAATGSGKGGESLDGALAAALARAELLASGPARASPP